jgi:sensor histidine kinase YesM
MAELHYFQSIIKQHTYWSGDNMKQRLKLSLPSSFFALVHSAELWRWLTGLFLAALLEVLIFSILFFFQNADDINTPSQRAWLTSYGVRSLEEFLWKRYCLYEMVRRLPWAIIGIGVVYLARFFPIMANSTSSNGNHAQTVDWRNVMYHCIAGASITTLYGIIVQSILTVFFGSHNVTFPFYVYLRNFNGLFLSVLHYILILTIATMIRINQKYRAEELRSAELETELVQAQLEALKMQLQPHFLFNALNSISSLLYKHPRRADAMISRLGNFLRMTLDNPTTQFVSLKQELDLLKCYVDIEMMRFPKRLHVDISVDASLQEAEIPNLLLQPLVENSIKYGILQSVQGGNIWIRARRTPSSSTRLEITVRDNGPGMKPSEHPIGTVSEEMVPENVMQKKSSIGLQNTRSRLQKLYGDEARFDTYNAPEGGFVVYIEMPLTMSYEEGLEGTETFYEEKTSAIPNVSTL